VGSLGNVHPKNIMISLEATILIFSQISLRDSITIVVFNKACGENGLYPPLEQHDNFRSNNFNIFLASTG
jgi:hypothetical protein